MHVGEWIRIHLGSAWIIIIIISNKSSDGTTN